MRPAMKRLILAAAVLLCAATLGSASGSEEDIPVDLSGIQVIVVRSGTLDVRISGTDASEVSLDPRVSRDPASDFLADNGLSDRGFGARVVTRREGSRLIVRLENEDQFPAPGSGEIRLRAPRDTMLVVETGSGRIFVDRLESRKCSVRTVSGRVRLYRVRGHLAAESVSGSIDLDSTEGGLEAQTVSGRITGRGLRLTADSSFSSVSGSIDVELETGLETLGFDLRSVAGSITVGEIRTVRGLRMGFGKTLVRGRTVSGAMSFQ
jgi:DUF4097 and DUF4098 domain-containing protein YvlB